MPCSRSPFSLALSSPRLDSLCGTIRGGRGGFVDGVVTHVLGLWRVKHFCILGVVSCRGEHLFHDALAFILLAVGGAAVAAPPHADFGEGFGPGGSLAVDEPAGVADEGVSVPGGGFVFAEEYVEYAVVPVRFGRHVLLVVDAWRERRVGKCVGREFCASRLLLLLTAGRVCICRSMICPDDNIGSRRRRQVCSARGGVGADALFGSGSVVGCRIARVIAGLVRLLFVFAAILLNELQRGVVFGGIFQLLDCFGALVLVGFQAGARGVDVVCEVC